MAGEKTSKVKFDIAVASSQAVAALKNLNKEVTTLDGAMKRLGSAMRGDFMAKMVKDDRANAKKGQRFFEQVNDAKISSAQQTVRKQQALGNKKIKNNN